VVLRKPRQIIEGGFKDPLRMNAQSESQLIVKLFSEIAKSESVDDTICESLSLLIVQLTVLQSTAHLGTRPAVPLPFRVSENEFYALADGVPVMEKELIGEIVEIACIQWL